MGASRPVTLQQFPVKAMEAYGEVEFSRLDRKLAMFNALPEQDRSLLPEYETRIQAIAECIDANATLLSRMAASASSISSPRVEKTAASPQDDITSESAGAATDASAVGTELDEEKIFLSKQVRRGFELLTRDWSSLGEEERSTCYTPLINAVETAYAEAARAARSLSRARFRVLVPGAGAGRLPWELARRGFAVEGCEESFTALLVGNYALNNASPDNITSIYPFAHAHSNVRACGRAVRSVDIPDVNPKDIPHATDFAMRAGSFVEAYEGQDNAWDAVASCLAFSLSDAVIGHVRRVSQILKPGGVWAFVGPSPILEASQMEGVHLSVEEFLCVVRKSGFKIITEDRIRCQQVVDPDSMRSVYIHCPFVVAIKVRRVA